MEESKLFLEVLFIHVVVHKLCIECSKSELSVLFPTSFLHLCLCEFFVAVLLYTREKLAETLEVVAVGSEIRVEVAIEVKETSVFGVRVGLLEV